MLFTKFCKFVRICVKTYWDFLGSNLNAMSVTYVIVKIPHDKLFICCITFACVYDKLFKYINLHNNWTMSLGNFFVLLWGDMRRFWVFSFWPIASYNGYFLGSHWLTPWAGSPCEVLTSIGEEISLPILLSNMRKLKWPLQAYTMNSQRSLHSNLEARISVIRLGKNSPFDKLVSLSIPNFQSIWIVPFFLYFIATTITKATFEIYSTYPSRSFNFPWAFFANFLTITSYWLKFGDNTLNSTQLAMEHWIARNSFLPTSSNMSSWVVAR